jgi:Skp family chaperone for outer membrane proteins
LEEVTKEGRRERGTKKQQQILISWRKKVNKGGDTELKSSGGNIQKVWRKIRKKTKTTERKGNFKLAGTQSKVVLSCDKLDRKIVS